MLLLHVISEVQFVTTDSSMIPSTPLFMETYLILIENMYKALISRHSWYFHGSSFAEAAADSSNESGKQSERSGQ